MLTRLMMILWKFVGAWLVILGAAMVVVAAPDLLDSAGMAKAGGLRAMELAMNLGLIVALVLIVVLGVMMFRFDLEKSRRELDTRYESGHESDT